MQRLSLVSVALAACAGAPAVPPPMPAQTEGGGGVIFVPSGGPGTGATFGERRVVGPTVNMALTPEGVWGGDLRGRNLVLEITEGTLSSVALQVSVERQGEELRVAGLMVDRRVNFLFSPRRVQGTLDGGACSFELEREGPELYRGFVACAPPRRELTPAMTSAVSRPTTPVITSATLRVSGEAAQLDRPVLPQLVLALLAVLPP